MCHWNIGLVIMTYSGRPTNEEIAEFFAVTELASKCEQKGEKFIWEFRFPQTDTPLAPMFSIRFIAAGIQQGQTTEVPRLLRHHSGKARVEKGF